MRRLQRALSLIYPDQCLLCRGLVDRHGALCSACWGETPFLTGLVCDLCGAPLPGERDGAHEIHCDDCLALPRPWQSGRAALAYRDGARRLVLALKHGDRTDLARPAAQWMAQAGRGLLSDDTVFVPIPVHWTRRLRRKYNQAAELARALSRVTGRSVVPDALVRTRQTPPQDGMSVDARFANIAGSIEAHTDRVSLFRGKSICLVDDVMTSGATLASATEVCHAAGAARVSVLVLARVEKTP